MKKYILILSSVILLISVIYKVSSTYETGLVESSNIDNQHDSQVSQSENLTDNQVVEKKFLITTKGQEFSKTGDEVPHKIPYEEDWCIKGVDLTEKDYAFAQQEIDDWRNRTGEIWLNQTLLDGNYTENRNAELLTPYQEMNPESLLDLAKKDDRYAMIAALQRQDLEWDEQTDIANRLLVLGTTSMSLIHLINREMAYAKVEYDDKNRVTPKVRKRLVNALTYVSYGITQFDSSALTHYVSLTDYAEITGDSLLPNLILSAKDFEQVEINVQFMTEKINEQQIKENLPTFNEHEVPKAARQEFQSRLAFLYLNYQQSIERLRRLPLALSSSIGKTKCVERYLSLYASTP